MSFNGEAVFMFGALTAGGVYLLTRQLWTPTLCRGIARGLNINASHAYLPPMWLLSLVGIALGAPFLLKSRPRPVLIKAEPPSA